jgi:hypothetical protein
MTLAKSLITNFSSRLPLWGWEESVMGHEPYIRNEIFTVLRIQSFRKLILCFKNDELA